MGFDVKLCRTEAALVQGIVLIYLSSAVNMISGVLCQVDVDNFFFEGKYQQNSWAGGLYLMIYY